VTIYAGYRIWRAGHPAANVWRELGRRGQAVAGFIAALVALLAIQAFPQVVAAIVGPMAGSDRAAVRGAGDRQSGTKQ
jgi:hypothetical protein